jgi:hypothetical protein
MLVGLAVLAHLVGVGCLTFGVMVTQAAQVAHDLVRKLASFPLVHPACTEKVEYLGPLAKPFV